MIWGNGKLWETVETDFLDFFVLSKLDSCFNNCDSISMSMSQIQLAESITFISFAINGGHQVQTMKIEGMTIKRISNDTKEF